MMDIRNLMIGDWIEEIHDSLKPRRNFRKITDQDFITRGVKITPIPLTPEILAKNGFVSIDNGCKCVRKWNIGEYTYADMSVDCDVEVDMLNGTSSFLHIRVPHIGILGMPLYYVHTLQHALRLCGLDELADNFKI